ncbi:MAG: hypothetical protein Q4A98_09935 [Comamonadaceae bacterium]|nr:hypothetical protein [Comamonadaceae bacterium]
MPQVNWDVFCGLPGAATENFEKLCRSLIRRHYDRFGHFKQLANQPGIEFHLELTEPCDLGKPPRWIGWQCKWYDLNNGQNLGTTRRNTIVDGIKKALKHVPNITDWKLWTHHILTKQDQEWFFGLGQSEFPDLNLGLLTAADIEDLLVGPGALLRESYFGELVLTPDLLLEQHQIAAAPFKNRYQPDVHVPVKAETKIFKYLGRLSTWESLNRLSDTLNSNCAEITSLTNSLKTELNKAEVDLLLAQTNKSADLLDDLYAALEKGNFDAIEHSLSSNPAKLARYNRLLSKLRGTRSEVALLATNLVADLHEVSDTLRELEQSVRVRAVAVLAPAGAGKSELAVKITQADGEFPGGGSCCWVKIFTQGRRSITW